MKKTHSTIVTFILTFALAITTVMTSATVALAAENDVAMVNEEGVATESTIIQPRVSVVYPISGSTSGYFTGLKSTNNAKFGNIPAGKYHFSYSYASDGLSGTIVIESSSQRVEVALVGDGSAHNSASFNLNGGTYTVSIIASPQSQYIEKSYGHDLILE